MRYGSLTPRLRDEPGHFQAARRVDPVSELYRRSTDRIYASADLIAPELPPRSYLSPEELAARVESLRWLDNPVWEATEPSSHYHRRGEALLSHATHGDVRQRRDDLDGVDTASHLSSDVILQEDPNPGLSCISDRRLTFESDRCTLSESSIWTTYMPTTRTVLRGFGCTQEVCGCRHAPATPRAPSHCTSRLACALRRWRSSAAGDSRRAGRRRLVANF